ncbi:unnamed protein product [Linum trigynum]|uniref:Uncharacterized protein n=1 Tax=Linum trigynum TaxID=586398 RepID=A0AAV2DC75_9ROSI
MILLLAVWPRIKKKSFSQTELLSFLILSGAEQWRRRRGAGEAVGDAEVWSALQSFDLTNAKIQIEISFHQV